MEAKQETKKEQVGLNVNKNIESVLIDSEEDLNWENESNDEEDAEADIYQQEISNTCKEKAYKLLDESLSFRKYKAVIEEGRKEKEEVDSEKKNWNKQERSKRIRKFLPPALEGLMGQANMCFVKGDHESALQMCLEIIRQVPTAPEPFQTLAELYEEKGMKENSLQFAMIAAHLNPKDSEQWIHLGERSLQLNNLADAITCYSRAVKYDPSNINAHIVKCQLLEQKNDRKAAIKAYHKLVESVKPEYGSQILEFAKIAAHHYHEDNEIVKAKEVMETAIAKVPDLVTSEDVNLYVELLMMVKDYIKALETIAKYCDVKIEAEEDILADDSSVLVTCSTFRILSCEVPKVIPIEIHVKLLVILIHLKSCHLLENLLTPLLDASNVEESGDLYIDVIEALISEGMHIEALKLLKLLIESKNYSLPAVWLNYAECLKHLGKLEEAVTAYLNVMHQAPKHVEARLMVSQLLNELGRSDEAISVLTQDPDMGSLDTGLLYEKCLLLNGLSERTDEFLAVGRLLLSRHCVKITKRDDLKLLSKLKGYARKQEAMKKTSDVSLINEPELVEGKRLPTPDGEWELFLSLCKTAYDTKQYALLQRLAFSALGSPVLNTNEKREGNVFFIALLSCYYNKDLFHGYNFARDMILNNTDNPRALNLFNLMLLDAEDSRHYRFIMRQLSRKPTHSALAMLYANNCFISGTYKYALSEYMSAYKQEPSAILALMISVTLLQMACQKFSEKKNLLVTQCIAFLWQYKTLRGEFNMQEVHYNMGRLFHQIGLFSAALFHYKKALALKSPVVTSDNPEFDLKREIAFNISLIYQNSGCFELARHYTENLRGNLSLIVESGYSSKLVVALFVDGVSIIMSVADSISFSNFCQLCTKISESSHDKKGSILQNYIQLWRKKAEELKKIQPHLNDNFYPALRLLLPQLDKERGAYGIKEHTLARIYVRILSLPKEGRDAVKLLDYRAPKSSGKDSGDFAEVAYWILKSRCAEGGQLSIEEVNNHLDAIATAHASNEPRGVDSELISLLKVTSAEEQKWLTRILLKDMKFGIGHNGILNVFHHDARDLHDACYNLKKVCEVLKDPSIRLHEIEIELFSPFKPMLAEECDIRKVDVLFKRTAYVFAETKLDGERFQIHMNEGNYKYFSRNGYDYTSNFGSMKHEGILTPRLADCFKTNVKSCILDGEMMSWNPETKEYASKGKNIDVKNLKESSFHQPCFCVFDILFYNNKVLTNLPLNCRLDILEEILNPLDGVISFVSRKRISTPNEAFDLLNEAIDNREEGVVLKEFMSVYKPNVRKHGGWFKVKPEYTDGLTDTLDLLILGGYYGSGRHAGKISHFLLGVAVDLSEESKLFYSVARVGSGYTTNELDELQGKLEPFWKMTKTGEMPKSIEWTKEKPDVWIPPERSFILEVKATEITCSNLFKTGYTLRFPRVEKVRYDKSWNNCLTMEEFEEKRKLASGKLTSRHLIPEEVKNVLKKKTPRSGVVVKYKGIDESSVERLSNILTGIEICVFTGFNEVTKHDVEKKIVEYGGTVVQNPGKNTFCVLAETDSTVRIKNIIKCESHDVIQTSFFYSQLHRDQNNIPEFRPENYLSMTSKTSEHFKRLYDEYEDHYTEPLTSETINHAMKIAMKKSDANMLTIEEKYNLDLELFSGPSFYSMFRLCLAYFDRFPILEDPVSGLLPDLEISEIDFRFFGGKCSRVLSSELTHVVVFSGDLSRLEEINRRNRERDAKFHVVTEKWIQYSIANKYLSEDDGF